MQAAHGRKLVDPRHGEVNEGFDVGIETATDKSRKVLSRPGSDLECGEEYLAGDVS